MPQGILSHFSFPCLCMKQKAKAARKQIQSGKYGMTEGLSRALEFKYEWELILNLGW